MIPKLQAQGSPCSTSTRRTPGAQAMGYAPTAAGQHISYVAGKVVQQKINRPHRQRYATTQKVDIVAHSMGGLVSRFLVEKPGADVDSWSTRPAGTATASPTSTPTGNRVDDLIMLGTPNHGTCWAGCPAPAVRRLERDRRRHVPNSKLPTRMGYAEKAGEYYTCIGGDPWYLQWLQYDYNGDGIKHGFDGVVPAESPFLTGCTTRWFPTTASWSPPTSPSTS